MTNRLTSQQMAVVESPLQGALFLEGPAGCGKTTAAVERLLYLLTQGTPAQQVLILTPQRSLAEPYLAALRSPGLPGGGLVTHLTIAGLARRMLDLFWPLVAGAAGFLHPNENPVFLTLETAQYYMARIVRPLLAEGYFEAVIMDRNRLYSQILDNLNKAALVGFPYQETGKRLSAAWTGEKGRTRLYQDTQDCMTRFRIFCLENNLLDFSLLLETFHQHIWRNPTCAAYLKNTYRHLIFDNLEEDPPLTHDLLAEWLPDLQTALLIYDHDGAYRRFMGADARSAISLRKKCIQTYSFSTSFVTTPALEAFAASLRSHRDEHIHPSTYPDESLDSAFEIGLTRYYPQMLDWAAEKTAALITGEGVAPDEIVILAPYLNDALRFILQERLESLGVPVRSQRPSRSLHDEEITRCLLTLLCLAHPDWGIHPSLLEVTAALVQAIEGLDFVRASLLAGIVYRKPQHGSLALSSFDLIRPDMQERITYVFGKRYETLRGWLAENIGRGEETPDAFISRLFGEILSQPGFGFHNRLFAGEITANLIESIQKFRWAAAPILDREGIPLGREYRQMVQEGVLSALYARSWTPQEEGLVILSPAYTFIMRNRPVSYQIWLDIGNPGWVERIEQPLTHPYILSRQWPADQVWTDMDESQAGEDALDALICGLTRRCRRKIFLAACDLNEQGLDQRGYLLRSLDRILRHIHISEV